MSEFVIYPKSNPPLIGNCYYCWKGIPYFSAWRLQEYKERESRLRCGSPNCNRATRGSRVNKEKIAA